MATVLTVAALAISAYGAVQSAEAQKSAANYQAKIEKRNAVIAGQQTDAALIAQRREASKRLGDMRASFSASGVTWEGSALDVLEESVGQAELERQNIQYQGKLRQMGHTENASLELSRGRNAATAGYLSASSALMSGGAKAYDAYGASSGGSGPKYYDAGGGYSATSPDIAARWREYSNSLKG